MINDTRSQKTVRALIVALSSLLELRNFSRITVTDICQEAMVSRAAFYGHFLDKYDLLKIWLRDITPDTISIDGAYEHLERIINEFVNKYKPVIRNVAYGADQETLDVLFGHMAFVFGLELDDDAEDKSSSRDSVMFNFYGGGMVYYLLRLTDNNFPANVAPMNACLYEIIKQFRQWRSE